MSPISYLTVLCLLGPHQEGDLRELSQEEAFADVAPVETILPEETVVLPLELTRGWPEVLVYAGDEGPYRMIVDTGASVTVLGERMRGDLGLESEGTTRIGDPTNPTALEVDLVELPSLFLGDAAFYDMTAITWEDQVGLSPMGIDGVVGRPVFGKCLLEFDYPAQELRLRAGELPPVDGHRIVGFEPNSMPSFDIDVAGRTVEAHFDSGNSGNIILPGSLEKELTLVPGTEFAGSGRRASGPMEVRGGVLEGSIRLAGLVLEKPRVAFDDSMTFANVGSSILREGPVTFDLANGRMELGAVEPAQPSPSPRGPAQRRMTRTGGRRLGISLARRGGGEPSVAEVMGGSLAERSGLRAGDVLLDVGGDPVTMKGDGPLARALGGSEAFTIRVRRGEEELSIQIPAAS